MRLPSPQQLAVLRALRRERRYGLELARSEGLSETGIYQHLHRLEAKGLVRQSHRGRPFEPRYWELTSRGAILVDGLSGLDS